MKNLITELIEQDIPRKAALQAVASLHLPDCYIAAGFVRNLVWDHLHGVQTTLNDIDVIFFDPSDPDNKRENIAQHDLQTRLPNQRWQVKNQAFTHIKNKDRPYTSSLDAMSFWPEKETAVGVRQNNLNEIDVISAFGTESLQAGLISYNPKRQRETFEARLKDKKWLVTWPKLNVQMN